MHFNRRRVRLPIALQVGLNTLRKKKTKTFRSPLCPYRARRNAPPVRFHKSGEINSSHFIPISRRRCSNSLLALPQAHSSVRNDNSFLSSLNNSLNSSTGKNEQQKRQSSLSEIDETLDAVVNCGLKPKPKRKRNKSKASKEKGGKGKG